MGAKILKGASIGDDSVIGAGSVVTGGIPAGVIAAGNPAADRARALMAEPAISETPRPVDGKDARSTRT